MRRKAPVPFGKGPTEKDPHHGHLAGGLLHSEGGRRKRTSPTGTSSAAYPTARPVRGETTRKRTRERGHLAAWSTPRARVRAAAARTRANTPRWPGT